MRIELYDDVLGESVLGDIRKTYIALLKEEIRKALLADEKVTTDKIINLSADIMESIVIVIVRAVAEGFAYKGEKMLPEKTRETGQ
ncbi:MAG: hypothetical protein FWH15_07840 [Betaproteobacteria bacterium]|nr:hypothetical protein [Betaproteobacteria bacterium]